MPYPDPVRTESANAKNDGSADLKASTSLIVHERRPLADALVASFARSASCTAFDVRAVLTADDPVSSLPSTLREAPAMARLEADLRDLVPRFLALTGKAEVFARLKVVDMDACRRFHRDFIQLRTVVTYTGPGTQWLDEGNVRRAYLDEVGDVDELNDRVVVDWNRVHHAAPGDALWLTGARASPGAVHRSPPVQGTGIRRVVLKLDDQAIRSA